MTYKNRLHKRLTWFLAILFLSSILMSPALARADGYGNWHMGRWMMGGWGMGGFGMIFMIIFWGLIITGIVLLIRWLIQTTSSRGQSAVGTGSKAMDILEERYAGGEITRDEFESMKRDILK